MLFLLEIFLKILTIIIPLLIAIAYFTLMERKVLASIQRRKGPNIIGIFGLLQPLADGLKLLLKEIILPYKSNKLLFILAPLITLTLSFLSWSVIPFGQSKVVINLNLGILYLLAISSLSVYGIIIAGWSSNSKYAFSGALRSAAQMISYEVSIGLIIITLLLFVGSLNLTEIILAQQNIWYCIPLLPFFIIFFISTLAETNRPPFDLPEAEAESVAGYNVEYSSMGFALFFLGEYSNIMLMSALTSCLFLGGWFFSFALKILFLMFIFIWIRGAFPRYRYDQLMYSGWKVFLPISLSAVIFLAALIYTINLI